jgi:hypothetical protein
MEAPSAGWNLLTHATFSARNHPKGTSMEHAANDNAVYGRGVQIFAAGDNCCAVCAPAILCEKEIESAAARGEPRGSILTWRSRTAQPRPCPYDGGRLHWLLVRQLKR